MDMLRDALFAVGLTLIIVALATGLVLLAAPAALRPLAQRLDRWRSLRPISRPVEAPHYMERRFYRHHRPAGLIIVIFAAYTLLRLAGLRWGVVAVFLPTAWPAALREALAHGLVYAVLAANVLALVTGVVIFARPSLLKHIEANANRWVSTRRALKPFDVPRYGVDALLWQHHRLSGAFLVVGALYAGGILLAYHYGLL